ncbi:hypothetical protein ACFQVC_40885 [Streptomyces monticola]|uniref:Tetratricopeptide repeat protein n=1 Tax=Streptomyces monticola TaxID=2666263 RepID=A0ABW2JXV8_9ACTN
MAEQQEQTADDDVMARAGQAVMLHRAGDREEARNRLLELWTEIGQDGDPLHRITIAHYIADTQDDPADELAWDLRALTAADALTGKRLERHHRSLAVRALYPSLHLNLAADYLKLHREEEARTHLRRARSAIGALGDDSYGDGVRAAIERLELRLRKGDEGPPPPATGPDGPPPGGPVGPPRRRS